MKINFKQSCQDFFTILFILINPITRKYMLCEIKSYKISKHLQLLIPKLMSSSVDKRLTIKPENRRLPC
jgi:hypothetical protein